ncbi:MAG: ABC transporter permease, partial [Bacteroidota bacterium]
MFDRDKWQEIFGTIRQHKLRTILTAFSVWWGIFMLVILLGAGTGMQNSVLHNFRDDAANALFVRSGTTSEPYKGLPAGRRIRFTNDDYDVVKEVEGVVHHSGRYYLWGEFFTTYKNKSLAFNIKCIHPGHQIVENTEVIEGRYINDQDIDERRKVCVIGRLVKEGFFEEGEAVIGEYLNVKGIDYRIVGVFNDSGGDWENRNIYLPISTAQLTEGSDRVHSMALDLGDVTFDEAKAIEEQIRADLAVRHKFSAADRSALRIWNKAESSAEFNLVFGFIKGFI